MLVSIKHTWTKNGSYLGNYAAIQDPYILRFKSCYCLNEKSYYQNDAECKLEKDEGLQYPSLVQITTLLLLILIIIKFYIPGVGK